MVTNCRCFSYFSITWLPRDDLLRTPYTPTTTRPDHPTGLPAPVPVRFRYTGPGTGAGTGTGATGTTDRYHRWTGTGTGATGAGTGGGSPVPVVVPFPFPCPVTEKFRSRVNNVKRREQGILAWQGSPEGRRSFGSAPESGVVCRDDRGD